MAAGLPLGSGAIPWPSMASNGSRSAGEGPEKAMLWSSVRTPIWRAAEVQSTGDDQAMVEATMEHLAQFVLGQLFIGEVLRHQLLVRLHDALDELARSWSASSL